MIPPLPKGMETEDAREKKRQGHRAEQEFAGLLGDGAKVYDGASGVKKDVVDRHCDSYSVKAGGLKWQIFLYGRRRFLTDVTLQAVDGVGGAFVRCLDAFPEDRRDYTDNREAAKESLRGPMRTLKAILEKPINLKAFLKEALFAGGVDYFAIKEGETFHVFASSDVLDVLSKMTVENSRKRAKNQREEQKVIFKWDGGTVGELEIRTDEKHYREMKFWMFREATLTMLRKGIALASSRKGESERILRYKGAA